MRMMNHTSYPTQELEMVCAGKHGPVMLETGPPNVATNGRAAFSKNAKLSMGLVQVSSMLPKDPYWFE